MSSLRKVQANRRNARRSTGPKTPEGKRRSAQNARTHNLTGKEIVLTLEDQPEFDALQAAYTEEFNPRSQTERDLVKDIASARWRISRICRIETASLDTQVDLDIPAVDNQFISIDDDARLALAFRNLADNSTTLQLIHRYEGRFHRQYNRAQDKLRALRQPPPLTPANSAPILLTPSTKKGKNEANTEVTGVTSPAPAPPAALVCLFFALAFLCASLFRTSPMGVANESLIHDGRSQSGIRQGVTLEVLGEGESMGPPNVASFLGAATPRIAVIGEGDRAPTPAGLDQMRAIVRQAMEEGAVGIASSLIYPPGSFAKTAELIELAKVAAGYGGLYISHLRSEGSQLVEAAQELLAIAREANIRAEIYHLKASGKANWPQLEKVIALVEQARAAGLSITADTYTYPAGSTGLTASMPPWVQDGGFDAMLKRLRDPAARRRIAGEMRRESAAWENMYLGAGTPDNILLVGFKSEKLKPLTGKTLAEVARLRGRTPEETVMDLILDDGSRIGTVYFTQSEEHLKRKIALPWVTFCSDSPSLAPEGVFLKSSVHPRAYGSFARLLAKYVREEKVIPLEEAVRRLAALPAQTLRVESRGMLKPGYFADVVVFDPARVQDHATYGKPHQYATGMVHVFVNGVQALKDGEHTGAKPGRFVKGPGWKPKQGV